MPARIATRTEVLDRLMESFRTHGYDGASLSTLSKRTGLGKSSLYHHFPRGKEQMALEVLAHLNAGLLPVFEAVAAEEDVDRKLEIMLQALDEFYEGGRRACLLERLGASVDSGRFSSPLRSTFVEWMSALTAIARAAGLGAPAAQRRAEDAVVRIEGALVVAAGMNDPGVFARTLDELRATFLRPDQQPG
jgi:AcrR family transcriptional regulator